MESQKELERQWEGLTRSQRRALLLMHSRQGSMYHKHMNPSTLYALRDRGLVQWQIGDAHAVLTHRGEALVLDH